MTTMPSCSFLCVFIVYTTKDETPIFVSSSNPARRTHPSVNPVRRTTISANRTPVAASLSNPTPMATSSLNPTPVAVPSLNPTRRSMQSVKPAPPAGGLLGTVLAPFPKLSRAAPTDASYAAGIALPGESNTGVATVSGNNTAAPSKTSSPGLCKQPPPMTSATAHDQSVSKLFAAMQLPPAAGNSDVVMGDPSAHKKRSHEEAKDTDKKFSLAVRKGEASSNSNQRSNKNTKCD